MRRRRKILKLLARIRDFPRHLRPWLRPVQAAGGRFPLLFLLPLAAVYLSAHLVMPVTSLDEAQQADYLQRIASGQMPNRDFTDIYGPVNWLVPAAAYQLAGKHWLGVRVYMLLLVLLVLSMAFRITRRLSSLFHAIWLFFLALAFFGVPLPANYTPYACMQVYPLTLGVMWLLLTPKRVATKHLALAGLLTGLSCFIKINSGLFLWLAGLWVCFYACVPQGGGPGGAQQPEKPAGYTAMGGLKYLGAAAYFAVLFFYVRPNYETPYFWHLLLPLATGLLFYLYLWRQCRTRTQPAVFSKQEMHALWCWGFYGISTMAGLLVCVMVFVPSGTAQAMLRQLPGLLARIDYKLAFTPLWDIAGNNAIAALQLGGWLQMPWLATWIGIAAGTGWWLRQPDAQDQASFAGRRAWKLAQSIAGLFMFAVLGHSVIYPTPDIGHLSQSLLIWMIFLAVGLYGIEQVWTHSPRARLILRCLMLAGLVFWIRPLAAVSLWSNARGTATLASQTDWYTPGHLRAYDRLFETKASQHRYVRDVLAVAEFLRAHMGPQDRCWTLSKDQLIQYYANQPLFGGKDAFAFYLAQVGRLDRDGFLGLASPGVWAGLRQAPPRFIIDALDGAPLPIKARLPEIGALLREAYHPVYRQGKFTVYERAR